MTLNNWSVTRILTNKYFKMLLPEPKMVYKYSLIYRVSVVIFFS